MECLRLMSPLPSLIVLTSKDVSNLPFQNRPLAGILFQKSFKPTQVSIVKKERISAMAPRLRDQAQPYELIFTSKTKNDPSKILVEFNLDPEDALPGTELIRKPLASDESMSPLFLWKGQKRALSMGLTRVTVFGPKPKQTHSYTMQFSARLTFGEPKKGKIPGKILLSLPKQTGFLSGTFTAFQK